MTTYTRDDQLAVQPEGKFGGKIETSGAYTGRLTLAKERTAKTGTKGLEFTFESDEGQQARYLSLWVERANGDKIDYGYALLSALMTCLGVKAIESTTTTLDEWQADTSQWLPAQVEVFESLMNQPIGLLLQREERVWEGKTQVSMKIVEFFDPRSRRTPAEILTGESVPQALERLAAGLRESVVRAYTPPAGAPAGRSDNGFSDIADDDIPF
ncbi:MAG: hypothetical protein IPG66_03615 [Hydrogenophilales bacterium]|nr:hypothetical protein [Hydrogenophilales bacterium]